MKRSKAWLCRSQDASSCSSLMGLLSGSKTALYRPKEAQFAIEVLRTRRLQLDPTKELISPHNGPACWVDIDAVEGRYLLVGGADATVSLFDLEGTASVDGGEDSTQALGGKGKHMARTESISRSLQGTEAARGQGHCYSVSSVQWYPVDTGLFVSAAMDGVTKVWDTNHMEVVLEFPLKSKVFAASMSPVASRDTVIAVGSDHTSVRLCDLKSGGFTHSLPGHREAVWCIAWAPFNENLLTSGGRDGRVLYWDIRRSGASACLHSFDMSGRDGGRRLSMSEHTIGPQTSRASSVARAHAGAVNSLAFSRCGRFLLSAGTDGRIRRWELAQGQDTLTNYLEAHNRRPRPVRMAIGGRTLFFPSSSRGDVMSYPLHSKDGRACNTRFSPAASVLKGHFEPALCCAFRDSTQELITGGGDGLLLRWSSPKPKPVERDRSLDEDAWSSGDEGAVAAFEPAIVHQDRGHLRARRRRLQG
ncbi:unnamed protein product [Chrysoparadoxa australica]